MRFRWPSAYSDQFPPIDALVAKRASSRDNLRVVAAYFEEKTYEVAYDVELASGSGGVPNVYAPGQVLEHLLGFDAAANPDPTHVLWRVLGTPRPRGVALVPDHWVGLPGARRRQSGLPSNPISFVVQYKRPEHLRGHRARQWHMWRNPYYRFAIDPAQQRVLKRLEINLLGEAIVRYAAPAFHTNEEMDTARLKSEVILRSGHVAPSDLVGHSVWTYRTPGHSGRANPQGTERGFQRLSDLFMEPEDFDPSPPVGSALFQFDPYAAHVRRLAEVVTDREPTLRRLLDLWGRALSNRQIPPRDIQTSLAFAAVQSMVNRLGASWWILDRNAVIRPVE